MVQYFIYFGRYIRKAMKNHAGLMNKLQIILKDELKFNSKLWKQRANMSLREEEDYLSLCHISVSGVTAKVSIKT